MKKSSKLYLLIILLLNIGIILLYNHNTNIYTSLLLVWMIIANMCLLFGIICYSVYKWGEWLDRGSYQSDPDEINRLS